MKDSKIKRLREEVKKRLVDGGEDQVPRRGNGVRPGVRTDRSEDAIEPRDTKETAGARGPRK